MDADGSHLRQLTFTGADNGSSGPFTDGRPSSSVF